MKLIWQLDNVESVKIFIKTQIIYISTTKQQTAARNINQTFYGDQYANQDSMKYGSETETILRCSE
jgi:hypothetical protein